MTDYIGYYGGVYNPSAPMGNTFQSYAESTGNFTQWSPDGSVVIGPTPMTAPQLALVASWDANQTTALIAATIQANIQAHMATIQAWIAASPPGAVLTAAQTLVLATMLYGIGLLLNQEFSSTTGT